MASVLIVAGRMTGWVCAMAVSSGASRTGRGMCRVRVLRMRVSRRGRSVVLVRRLAMFVWNTRGGRYWFNVTVLSRMFRPVLMR